MGTPADMVAGVANIVETEDLVPFHASVISQDKESVKEQLAKLEAEGITISNGMAIQVADQASYDAACLKYKEAKSFIDRAGMFIEPMRALTYALYVKVLGRKKSVLENVEKNLAPLSRGILAFERQKEQERIAEQQRLEALRRKEEDDRRIALAESAQKQGMDAASVESVLTAPSVTPAAVAPPTFSRVVGTTSREAWEAEPEEGLTPLQALKKLIAAAAKKDGAYLLPYLEAKMTAINSQARIAKAAMAIPGFHAVNKGALVNRR
jgi:hypothetical protein